MENKSNSQQTFVEIEKIKQRWETIRTFIRWVSVVIIALGICFTIYKVTETPPWLQALALFLGLLANALRPWHRQKEYRRYMKSHQQRLINLEKKVDPNRTTSGLNEDGRHPSDDN